jgi:hypothetical protein
MKVQEIQTEITKTLAHIETLAKVARFENVSLDHTAREISNAADRLKDLSYKLSLSMAVAS